MSITVRDCLRLPSLRLGNVIAGAQGLDKIVSSISVVEFASTEIYVYAPNELLISSFYSIKDNIAAQCAEIEEYKKSGEVGLVLFYSDFILKNIHQDLIDTANRLQFPIIALPGDEVGIYYSDVISEVMEAVIMDRNATKSFVKNTIERISQLVPSRQNIKRILVFASEYAKASFYLLNENGTEVCSALWPMTEKIDFEKLPKGFDMLKQNFTDNKGTVLTLCGVSNNNRLNYAVMNEIIETIQIFSLAWNHNLNVDTKESLITALIESDKELIESIAKNQNINLQTEVNVYFMDFDNPEDITSTLSNEIIQMFRRYFEQNEKKVIIDIFGHSIILLLCCETSAIKEKFFQEEIFLMLEPYQEKLTFTYMKNIDLVKQFRNIYYMYCNHGAAMKKIYPKKRAFEKNNLDFASHCCDIIASADRSHSLYLEKLMELREQDADVLDTLMVYLLDTDSQIKETAEQLFLHRNTVLYRIGKAKQILGIDFSVLPNSYFIYLALAMVRITNIEKA